MDPAFIPPTVPAELASLLNAASAPKEAQVQAALMRMLNQELDVLFEARVPEGVRLRLPQGQALIADGDLPYPEGTTLRVRVLPPPSGDTTPRLHPLSVQLPPLPAILAPLVQGEAFPMLQRLQVQHPPAAYRALAALFQHLEALTPLPATPSAAPTPGQPQGEGSPLPAASPQPPAAPNPKALPPVPMALQRPLAQALQDLLPRESPESLVARWLKLVVPPTPDLQPPAASAPPATPTLPTARAPQLPANPEIPTEPSPAPGASPPAVPARPSPLVPGQPSPQAPGLPIPPSPSTPLPQTAEILVAPPTSSQGEVPATRPPTAPTASPQAPATPSEIPARSAPPQPALLQDPGLPKEVREVLHRLWTSGAALTPSRPTVSPSGPTVSPSVPEVPPLAGLPAQLRQDLQAFLAPRLPAPPLEALLQRWAEAGPLPTPPTPTELVAEALQVLARPEAPPQGAAPAQNPILQALNPAPPELKQALVPVLRTWLAGNAPTSHPHATVSNTPGANPDEPRPPSAAQPAQRLEQDIARWPATAQLALAEVLGLSSPPAPGRDAVPLAPKDLAEAVVRWLQDLAPKAEGEADPTLKSAKLPDLAAGPKPSLLLRGRADLPEEVHRILNHPALPPAVKETAKAWFKAALAEPAPPQAAITARTEAPKPQLPPLNLKALELDSRLLGSLEARLATADASVLTHAEPWEAWVKASLQTLSSPQASPREAPFHALQALDGTAYFEVPLPGRASGPLQLWVETEAPARDPASPSVHRVLLGLQFTAIGATRIGLMMAGQALSVRIWAERPDLLHPGQEELRTALEAQGNQVSLQIAPLPSGSPDPRSLAVGPGYRGLA